MGAAGRSPARIRAAPPASKMRSEMACALVVTGDESIGDPIADALEAEGFEVMWCPGPHEPFFLCAGAHDRHCPLAACADVVVLDGWLASDRLRRGVPSWHLLLYYRNHDVPVVALVGPDGLPASRTDAGVAALPRQAAMDEVVGAVHALLERVTPARRPAS